LGLVAQWKVKSAYRNMSNQPSRSGRTADDVARELLAGNGNHRVTVVKIPGRLTDHYDPRKETLSLSEGVYGDTSLAAVGIAAHEAGHAMQKYLDYGPMALRNAIVPVVRISSQAYFPLFLLGIIFSLEPLLYIGILCFAASLVFSLITLPVEFDASRRGVRMLTEGGYISHEEISGVKTVLNAAALTYVAAAISSLLQLIRLLAISGSRRRR
jgi:Zn-dependent membrane protease YugP